jgi:predicted oxidoreductase
MNPSETGAVLDDLISSGKVRTVGVSNFKPHDYTLLQTSMTNTLVTNQIEISVAAHEAFTNGDIAFLQERGIAPMAWSPLAGGRLFDSSYPQLATKMNAIAKQSGTDVTALAVAWLLAHPAGILPVMGTNRLDRIAAFSKAQDITMNRQTWFEIYAAAIGQDVP